MEAKGLVRKSFLFLLLIAFHLVASAQENPGIVNRYKSKLLDTTDNPGFLLYPTIAYSPETRWEFGFVSLLLFYAKNDSRNRISEVNAFTFYTLENQYGIWSEHSIYTNKDRWFIQGREKYQYFPLLYYGVGPNTPNDPGIINSEALIIHERFMHVLSPNLFFGPMFDIYNMYNVHFEPSETIKTIPEGGGGSLSVGVGLSLTYNSRHNPLNSKRAKYLELSYLNYNKYIGSEYSFNNFIVDGRIYVDGFKKNHVWANQVFLNTNSGNLPFNMMALMGGELLMRGYYTGRHRDKNMLAAQTEYRILPFSFSKRLGAAAFFGAGVVAPTVPDLFNTKLYVAPGLGLRYNVFLSKDVNVRFDAAYTSEGMNYYFFLAEAF